MSVVGYRGDIDGLRAIAVLLVVLFHARLGVSGGHVGVDVFFVISGYLITGLLLRDLQRGTFSFVDFFLRRIRRILPAALVMTLVTLIVGAWFLPPADFVDLAESAIAHPLMSANLYFFWNTGYFDAPADLKPLLHTWSLSVEEQFYLLYPLLLWALWRGGPRLRATGLTAAFLVSLAISVLWVKSSPAAAFFLLPSRGWEMLLGAGLHWLPEPRTANSRYGSLLSVIGLLLIVGAALTYTSDTPFPGLAAAIPCVGAALVIWSHGLGGNWVSRGLSARPLVAVGQMSYSIYLWHWPLIVYLKFHAGDDLSLWVRFFVVWVSGLLGYLSWRFVENPFRYGTLWQSPVRVTSLVAAATSLVLLSSWYIKEQDGMPERFTPEWRRVFASMQAPRFHQIVTLADVQEGKLPEFGDLTSPIKCLVWGDSHAMALMPAVVESCEELKIHGYQATHPGTLPLIGFDSEWDAPTSTEYCDAVLKLIHQVDFDLIVMAGFWSRESADPSFRASFQATLEQLRDEGRHVVLLRDIPIQQAGASAFIAAPFRAGGRPEDFGVRLVEHRRLQETADSVLAELDADWVTIADPTPHMMDEQQRCRIVLDGECLYSDYHHLSLAGARRLTPFLRQILENLAAGLPRRLVGSVVELH